MPAAASKAAWLNDGWATEKKQKYGWVIFCHPRRSSIYHVAGSTPRPGECNTFQGKASLIAHESLSSAVLIASKHPFP